MAVMDRRKLRDGVYKMGAIDWDRRLFDSLIPLPDGTSYNCYLIEGSEKVALLDTVDPAMLHVLKRQLDDVPQIDYVIAHHAEQDHSGSIGFVLEKYKNARAMVSPKCKDMLIDHLHIPADRVLVVNDGDTLPLGNKTLKFLHTPWVHWPETMVSYLVEDRILFSCDFFGSHLATSDLYVTDSGRVYEAAKRYYAEIMMPFRATIRKNIEKVMNFPIDMIAPSHGPVYDKPSFIIDAYKDWASEEPKNEAVIPFISMHGSTRAMVEHLVAGLSKRGISVMQFDLSVTDIGKVAISLVDAATIVIGTPTVHVGPHPVVSYAAHLVNALRPKLKFASVIGSYGWSSKAIEHIAALIPNLKVEIIPPVLCKGLPRENDYKSLDTLADAISQRHKVLFS
jgi:flavorubredoxin